MSLYRTGTVKVVPGSTSVIGYNTGWATYVDANDLFAVAGEDVFYTVASVTSATTLSLSTRYVNTSFQTAQLDDDIASVGAATQMYTGTVVFTPVIQTSLKLTACEIFVDDGSSVLTGDLGGTGTFDYDTGEYSITLGTNLSASYNVTASYLYGVAYDNVNYLAVRDFTSNFSFPYFGANDPYIQMIYNKAIQDVDSRLQSATASMANVSSNLQSIEASTAHVASLTASALTATTISLTDLTVATLTVVATNITADTLVIKELIAVYPNAAANMGFPSKNISYVATFIDQATNIAKPQNWQTVARSVVNATSVGNGFNGVVFDGRYVYFCTCTDNTLIRFDTTGLFTDTTAWTGLILTQALGTTLDVNTAFIGNAFDGRYVYYSPFSSTSFIRFDTTGDIDNTTKWSSIAMSNVAGTIVDEAYAGIGSDGKYLYYAPFDSNTLVRFDTTGDFINSTKWEAMSLSTAMGSADLDGAFTGSGFDGKYLYYSPRAADTFLRFDTTGTFTNSSSWEAMSMSTAQGAAAVANAYQSAAFDGRYLYFIPSTSDTFLRFDTTGAFTSSSTWERMSMSTAQGAAALDSAYFGASFDGRYVYISPRNADTFLRFDTTGAFTDSSKWSKMSMSTAQGAAALDDAYHGSTFDGKYIYFAPYDSKTFIRVLASESKIGYGKVGSP